MRLATVQTRASIARRAVEPPTCFQGASGPGAAVKVKITVPLRVAFGQQVAVVGSVPTLGAWAPEKAVKLDWQEGDEWQGEVEVPVGEEVAYKLLITSDAGRLEWQPGNNRTLLLPAEAAKAAAVQVLGDWASERHEVTLDIPAAPTATVVAPPAQAKPAAAAAVAPAPPAPSKPAPESTPVPMGPFSSLKMPAVAEPLKATASAAPAAAKQAQQNGAAQDDDDEFAWMEDLTTTQLKDRLKGLGQSTAGRKVDLLDRLREALGMSFDR